MINEWHLILTLGEEACRKKILKITFIYHRIMGEDWWCNSLMQTIFFLNKDSSNLGLIL
jgi:hypothetical protein